MLCVYPHRYEFVHLKISLQCNEPDPRNGQDKLMNGQTNAQIDEQTNPNGGIVLMK